MRWLEWLRRRPLLTPLRGTAPDDPRFLFFAGRRHLANVPYILPQDEREMSRMEVEHEALRQALGGNYRAPVCQPERILDVGSGSGRWVLDLAEAFPEAHVVGLDLVLPSPGDDIAQREAPPNFTFIRANVLEDLHFGDEGFDFVHMRQMAGAVPAAHWQAVAYELVRVTRPGGWVELAGAGMPVAAGQALSALHQWTANFAMQRGIDLTISGRLAPHLTRAGVTGAITHVAHLPLGQHGGHIGALLATNYLAGIEGLRGAIVDRGLATEDEFDETLMRARIELDTSAHTLPWYSVYGQRPR
jgi:SAM-dependent methyltransferase